MWIREKTGWALLAKILQVEHIDKFQFSLQ